MPAIKNKRVGLAILELEYASDDDFVVATVVDVLSLTNEYG